MSQIVHPLPRTPTRAARGAIALDPLTTARAMAAHQSPALRYMLWHLVYVEVTEGPFVERATLAVTSNAVLYYSKAALAKWTIEELAGVLTHECWHLWLDHEGRLGARDPEMANAAMDIAINSMLEDQGVVLPKTECTPGAQGFPRGLAWEVYYAMLQERETEDSADGGDPKDQPGGGKDKPGKGEARGRSRPGGGGDPFGQCGSGAGNPSGYEPSGEQQAADGGRSADDMERARAQTGEQLAAAVAADPGKYPGDVRADVARMVKPPEKSQLRWQTIFRRAVHHRMELTAGATTYTYAQRHRRQSVMDAILDVRSPILPKLVGERPRVLVAVDTSGSTTGNEGLVLGDVRAIIEATGAPISFCSWDVECTAIVESDDFRQIGRSLRGGGGTAVASFFAKLRRVPVRPSIVVITTDGYFDDCPAQAPPGISLFWLLVGRSTTAANIRFGKVIKTK